MGKLQKQIRNWIWPSARKVEGLRVEFSKFRTERQMENQKALCDATVFQNPEVEAIYRDLFRRINIKSVTGHKKKRFGRDSDGGYVMIDNLDKITCAYSLGIAREVSWDLDVAARGIPVLQFDDSVSSSPVANKLFTFYKKRIENVSNPALGHESIKDIINSHNHAGKKLIVKMDIEGSEWSVLDGLTEDVLAQFDQLVIEFHDFYRMPEYHFRERALRVFDKLNLRHAPVHIHANNCGRPYKPPHFYFSDILEITYVRTDNYTLVENQEVFPGEFDQPNLAGLPEIYLGKFKFD
jgi:hypothetical protein